MEIFRYRDMEIRRYRLGFIFIGMRGMYWLDLMKKGAIP